MTDLSARAKRHHDSALMLELLHSEAYQAYRKTLDGMIDSALRRVTQAAPLAHDEKTHWLAVHKALTDARDVPDTVIQYAKDQDLAEEAQQARTPTRIPGRWRK